MVGQAALGREGGMGVNRLGCWPVGFGDEGSGCLFWCGGGGVSGGR